jgi:hypothetical protein
MSEAIVLSVVPYVLLPPQSNIALKSATVKQPGKNTKYAGWPSCGIRNHKEWWLLRITAAGLQPREQVRFLNMGNPGILSIPASDSGGIGAGMLLSLHLA